MPRDIFGRDYAFLPNDDLLSFDELHRIARIAVAHGVERLRLTGGEPLLRKGLEELIQRLCELRTPAGDAVDVALTTNGAALKVKAVALREAGLDRLTVSLDSLDDERFQQLNDVRFPVQRVLDGIEAARDAGFASVKINAVVKRGFNDGDVLELASHFRGSGHVVRFIEYMDVGSTNGWCLDEVVPSAEIVERIDAIYPLVAAGRVRAGDTATRYTYADGAGEIGLISSVTGAFCSNCDRARISADGRLYTCLFATKGHDIRALLRSGCSDAELSHSLRALWQDRGDRYSELRGTVTPVSLTTRDRVEMSYIGG